MNVIIKKLVNLLLLSGIISIFIPDKLSKSIYNCIIVCFTVITLLNSISKIKVNFFNIADNNLISKYQRISKEHKKEYNIFFENIYQKELNNEKQNWKF